MDMQNQLKRLTDAVAALGESPARGYLQRLFDEGSFVELDRLARDGDKPAEAVSGFGMVNGAPVYAFAQDKTVCSGAVSKAQAAKIPPKIRVYSFVMLVCFMLIYIVVILMQILTSMGGLFG